MRPTDLISFDGTRLTVFEGGTPQGPPMILVNGLGGNLSAWHHVVQRFQHEFRLFTFDYRGLYTSDPATDMRRYRIEDHAQDLTCLIERYELHRPVLVGWSMGVQVSLEYLRQSPDGAAALVAINGTPGFPFHTAFDRNLHRQLRLTFRTIQRHWRKAMWAKSVVARDQVVQSFIRTVQWAGLASRRLDRRVFRELAMQFVNLDLGIYSEIFNRLGEHDATDVLPTLRVPALLIGGDRDRMTPMHRTALMAGQIPDSELLAVRGGTHFTPVEYPEQVNNAVASFLDRRGLMPERPTLRLARIA